MTTVDNELPFRLVLFWEPTEIVLDILEKSILQCSQKLDLGLLHPNIKILLLSKSKKQLQSLLATTLLRKHPRVAALELKSDILILHNAWGTLGHIGKTASNAEISELSKQAKTS